VFDGRDTYDLEAALRLTDSAWRVAVSLSVPLHDPPQAPTGNAPTSPPVTRLPEPTHRGNGPPKGDSGPFPAETASRLNTACGGGPQAQLRTLQVRLSAEDP
jgi:hypothetical protein